MASASQGHPDAPLFVIGVGRSGSTALHRLLALHPVAAWLSGLCDRYPGKPALNRLLLTAKELPGLGTPLRRRFRPGECWRFWAQVHPGFPRPYRDLEARDVTERDRSRFPQALGSVLPPGRKPVIKLTGWPRIGFLKTVFPSARFLHLVRDGRAVAASLLRVNFWEGWRGTDQWRWGPLPPDAAERWKAGGETFPSLAGLQWELLLNATRRAAARLPPNDFLEIRYEDLCAKPDRVIPEILRFSGLPMSSRFDRRARDFPLRNANHKWREVFCQEEQEQLSNLLRSPLEHYSYLPEGPSRGR